MKKTICRIKRAFTFHSVLENKAFLVVLKMHLQPNSGELSKHPRQTQDAALPPWEGVDALCALHPRPTALGLTSPINENDVSLIVITTQTWNMILRRDT